MNIAIIIPTYCEAENIALICQEIFLACGKSASGGEYSNNIKIIIVDDNSPDDTEKISVSLAQKNSRIQFVSRRGKPRSFAQSYIDGFKIAIADKADRIIQMDADFSHNPKYLSQMIKSLEGFDTVIGSRYINGGKIENWSFIRRLISRGGNLYARLITGLPVCDPTAGFVGWRREALQKINLDGIRSDGYGFQIEMKFRAYKNNSSIKEIPIVFADRKFGESKMNKKIILEAAWRCWSLRFLK